MKEKLNRIIESIKHKDILSSGGMIQRIIPPEVVFG